MEYKKKILVQSNTTPIAFFYFTKGQLNYLQNKNFSVHAITSSGDNIEDFFKKEGVVYKEISMEREISLLRDLKALWEIFLYLKRLKPQIVQGSTPKAAFLTLLPAYLLRVPARIFFMRGIRSSGLKGLKKKIVKCMEYLTCTYAHQVLSTSRSVRSEAIEIGLCKPSKMKVLHHGTGNGIDTDRFDPKRFSKEIKEKIRNKYNISPDHKILLFVGRIVRDKGIMELFQAWRMLKKKYPDLLLLMVGDEEKEDPIPSYVSIELQGDSRVVMTGVVSDTAPLYAISDILILPTYREGIPTAVLEASSMGLPIVATKVTGCVDAVIEGVTGILVPAKNHRKIAKAVQNYLEHPEIRQNHGMNGRMRIIKEFKPEVVWEALSEEYDNLLRNNTGTK